MLSPAPPSQAADSPDSIWPRLALAAVLLAAVILIISSDTLHRLVLQLFDAAELIASAHPAIGMALFVVFGALSALLAFFSSAVLTPVAVGAWGEQVSLALLWLGWTLGGMCAYAIGRTLGRRVVVGLITRETLERFEDRMSRQAPFGLILLFQLALPSEIPGYVLGLARYPFARYVLALSLAELPYAFGTVYLGASFLERRTGLLIGIAVAGVTLTGCALWWLRKRMSA